MVALGVLRTGLVPPPKAEAVHPMAGHLAEAGGHREEGRKGCRSAVPEPMAGGHRVHRVHHG